MYETKRLFVNQQEHQKSPRKYNVLFQMVRLDAKRLYAYF